MKQWLMDRVGDLEIFALHRLLPAIIIFAIGYLAIRIIMKLFTAALEKTKLEGPVLRLIRSLLRIVLYILLLLIVASAIGIDVTGIVALASVLTLAVSLAVQTALTNMIGGFTLLYTKPFVAGDYVEIAGQSGTVTEVGLNYTKLATADNKTISIPNSSVTATEIINYSTSGTRRLDITVSVGFDTPVEVVTNALLEAARMEDVLDAPAPFAGAKEYGESAIQYALQVWTPADRYWPAKYTINENIQNIFREKGISFAYPHVQIHMDK